MTRGESWERVYYGEAGVIEYDMATGIVHIYVHAKIRGRPRVKWADNLTSAAWDQVVARGERLGPFSPDELRGAHQEVLRARWRARPVGVGANHTPATRVDPE